MSPQAPSAPIVVHSGDALLGTVRANPAISKATFFDNFGAGYLVGASIAIHPKGEECGTHDHRGAVEMFVVLEGLGIIEIDGTRYHVSAHNCVVVPVGAKHNLIGVSDVPFRVLCGFVVAPGHEEDSAPWKSTVA